MFKAILRQLSELFDMIGLLGLKNPEKAFRVRTPSRPGKASAFGGLQ
jgi:hypothetical protein